MIETKSKVKGKYSFKVTRKDGSIEEINFPNLILDIALSKLQNGIFFNQNMRLAYVGSGTTPADVTDTGIENELGLAVKSASTVNKTVVGSSAHFENEFTYEFAVGQIIGVVSEVAIRNDQSVFCSRSLLSDIAGNPVSISLGEFDQLTITYKLTVILDGFDFTTIINIKGVDVSCRMVSVNPALSNYQNASAYLGNAVSIFTESIGSVTEGQVFDDSLFSNIYKSTNTYNVSDKRQTANHSFTLAPTEAVSLIYAIGVRSFTGSSTSIYIIIFDTPIDKTIADQFNLNTTISLDGVRL